jgi:hypothetical protein
MVCAANRDYQAIWGTAPPRHGRQSPTGAQKMNKNALVGAVVLLASLAGRADQVTIASATPTGGTLEMTAYDFTAGAFCSLTWNGKQFIDARDHGRCLQSASSFNGLGEQWNPTEAGASQMSDPELPGRSSSKLLNWVAMGNRAASETQMAFWYPVAGQTISQHVLRKWVTITGRTVKYRVQFEIPANESFQYGDFEVLCGYMPNEFSSFWLYDIAGHRLSVGVGTRNLQRFPVITATPDRNFAIGVWSPDPRVQYGYARFPDVLKWTAAARVPNPVGTHRFELYLVVGTLDDVVRGLQTLHANPAGP